MKETLSQYWNCIQGTLFPFLREELEPLSNLNYILITCLETARIEEFLKSFRGYVGRPLADRTSIARAFLAKAVYNIPTTVQLLDRLRYDSVLRRICGWERKSEIPSESTFSRAFNEFAQSDLPARAHEALIIATQKDCIIGHLSRDSTAVEAREKSQKKPKVESLEPPVKKKRGRPKKGEERIPPDPTRLEKQRDMNLVEILEDLPQACDFGTKVSSTGYKITWKGYKLHIDTADGDIPISCILTSASVHDSQAAIPLAMISSQRVLNLYSLMDAAYDAEIIREYTRSLGQVPLIDFNHRGPKDERAFDPPEAARYKERSAAERVNSQLKDNFGGRFIRVRGPKKVKAHLMFGILALTVSQIFRLIT
jgi:hypothetical protein